MRNLSWSHNIKNERLPQCFPGKNRNSRHITFNHNAMPQLESAALKFISDFKLSARG